MAINENELSDWDREYLLPMVDDYIAKRKLSMENKKKHKYRIRIVKTQSCCEIPIVELFNDANLNEWTSIYSCLSVEEAHHFLNRIKKGELDFHGRLINNGIVYECEI